MGKENGFGPEGKGARRVRGKNVVRDCASLLLWAALMCPAESSIAAGPASARGTPSRPNIVVIVTDDQGYGDLSMHGNKHLETPRLDALGREAMRFARFFVHSVCAPTRASLMTGMPFQRTGVWGVHEGQDSLALGLTTLPELLRQSGYRTAMAGKWHLGKVPGYLPWERGFDDAATGIQYNNRAPYTLQSRDREWKIEGSTSEQIVTDEALAWLKRRPLNQPFFLYVAYCDPHGPFVGPPDLVDKYKRKGLHEETANCYAEIESLDRQIGRLLDGLDEAGVRDSTLVMFFSDNGPAQGGIPEADWKERNPTGLRGAKASLYDNGVNVPLFVRWPKQITPRQSDALVRVEDVLPTLVELAGSRAALPDGAVGRSMMPLLTGNGDWPDRIVIDACWRPVWKPVGGIRVPDKQRQLPFEDQGFIIRNRQFKLIKPLNQAPMELYDTAADPRETADIAARHPELVHEWEAKLKTYWQETLNTPEAFRKPEMKIGLPEWRTSKLWTTGFEQWRGKASGSVKHEKLFATGDGFAGPVEVVTPGRYAVSLHGNLQGKGAEFRLAVGDALVTGTIHRDGDMRLGEITLEKKGPHFLDFVLTDPGTGGIAELYYITFETIDSAKQNGQ